MSNVMNKTFYVILRVQIEPDGRLQPLWYSVRSVDDWMDMTVVNFEYTLALMPMSAKTLEAACKELRAHFKWFAPLLKNAKPEPWLVEQWKLDDAEYRRLTK